MGEDEEGIESDSDDGIESKPVSGELVGHGAVGPWAVGPHALTDFDSFASLSFLLHWIELNWTEMD